MEIEMWVVYDHPKDYPNDYVARRWVNGDPTKVTMVTKDISEIRTKLADQGYIWIDRMKDDDPSIMETWI